MSTINNWFFDFLEAATLHGTFQLGERPHKLWYKIIWLIILFSSLTACLYCISKEVELFISNPISTLITPMMNKDPFPDVTICLKEPINKAFIDSRLPLFENFTFREINNKISKYWITIFENIRNANVNHQKSDLLLKKNFERAVNNAVKRSVKPYAFQSNILHSVELDIFDCLMNRNWNCNSTIGKFYDHPVFWQCLTFSEIYFPKIMLDKFSMVVYRLKQSSENLDPFPDPYEWTDSPIACIHEIDSIPDQSCINTNWNRIFLLTFSSYLHRKTKMTSNCIERKIYTPIRFQMSTKQINVLQNSKLCKRLKMQSEIIGKCGCYFEDLELPGSVNASVEGCHSLPWKLVNGSVELSDSIINSVVNRINCMHLVNEKSIKNCYDYCEERSFKVSSTFSQSLMDASLKAKYKYDKREYRKQKIRIENFDEVSKAPASLFDYINGYNEIELQSINIVRTSGSIEQLDNPSYHFLSFISNIGSQMGLWVGCSIISTIEIFELFFLLICKLLNRHCQKIDVY